MNLNDTGDRTGGQGVPQAGQRPFHPTILSGPYQYLSLRLLRCSEELIDITFTITDMDQFYPCRHIVRAVLQGSQPFDALFFFNRACLALCFAPDGFWAPPPNLNIQQAQGYTPWRDRLRDVQQQALPVLQTTVKRYE